MNYTIHYLLLNRGLAVPTNQVPVMTGKHFSLIRTLLALTRKHGLTRASYLDPESGPNGRFSTRRRRGTRLRVQTLEDRTVPALIDNLNAIVGASSQVATFGNTLKTTVLAKDIPAFGDGSAFLDDITSVSSTLSAISNRMTAFSPTAIANTPQQDQMAALQAALGLDFKVIQIDDTRVRIVYTKSLANQTAGVSVAGTAADFFGDAAPAYLSKVQLSGSGSATLQPGSQIQLVFGADSNGFFVEEGELFVGNILASAAVTGSVQIDNLNFDASATGTASLALNNLDLHIKANFTQPTLAIGPGSKAEVDATLTAKLLGIDLLSWMPSLSWAINPDGSIGALSFNPTAGGQPTYVNQDTLESQLISAAQSSLGLDKLGVSLNPLANVPEPLQQLISLVSGLTGDGLDDSQLGPQDNLNNAAVDDSSKFTFASGTDLLNIISGQGGTLVSYQNQATPVNYHTSETVPIGVIPVLDIVNFIFDAGASFDFQVKAGIAFGLDSTKGLYFDTTNTGVEVDASAGPTVGVHVNLLGVPNLEIANAALTAAFTTTAEVRLDDAINNGAGDNRVYLSDLGAAFQVANQGGLSLGGLGSFLANSVLLKMQFGGAIKLDMTLKSPAGAVLDALPPEVRDAIGPYAAQVSQTISDFVSGATQEICSAVQDVPVLGQIADDVGCQNVAKVAQLAVGDYLSAVDPAMQSIGATLDPANNYLEHTYHWTWPIAQTGPIIIGGAAGGGANAIAGGNDPNNGAQNPNQSGASEYIQYKVQNGVLTITGREGDDRVQVEAVGSDQVKLLRTGKDLNGVTHTDPVRTLAGVTSVVANLGDGNDFLDTRDLSVPCTVDGGTGNDTILTGSGPDSLTGGTGNDSLSGGDGNDTVAGNDGNDTIAGGGGADSLDGGDGNDKVTGGDGANWISGGAGNDTLYGGSGADTIFGGDNDDVIHGGAGINLLDGGAGNDWMFGDDGTNTMHGGLGNDTMEAGAGNDELFGDDGDDELAAGPGNCTVDGGAGDDEIHGRAGASRLIGGVGNDFIQAGNGDDTLIGGADSDILLFYNSIGGLLGSVNQARVYGGAEDAADPGQPGDALVLINGGGAGVSAVYHAGTDPNSGTFDTTDGTTKQSVRYSGVVAAYDVVAAGSFDAIDTDAGRNILVEDGGQSPDMTLTRLTFGSQTVSFAFMTNVTVDGAGGNDQILLNNPTPATDLASLTVHGGDGDDTIEVSKPAATVEYSLYGDPGNDLFQFDPGAAINGFADGGEGVDTTDLSGTGPAQSITVTDLGAIDGFNTTGGTAATAGFQNLDRLLASTGAPDRLTGRNADATWEVKAGTDQSFYQDPQSGRKLIFANFEELYGGAQKDDMTIDFSAGVPFGATGLTVDGQAGIDSLNAVGKDSHNGFTLGTKVFKVNKNVIRYKNFEKLTATGGSHNDAFYAPNVALPKMLRLVEFFGQGGDDTATVSPTVLAVMHLDGGDGTDTLHVLRTGERYLTPIPLKSAVDGTYLFSNRQRLEFNSFEVRDLGIIQPQP